jgi:hypothetical protein
MLLILSAAAAYQKDSCVSRRSTLLPSAFSRILSRTRLDSHNTDHVPQVPYDEYRQSISKALSVALAGSFAFKLLKPRKAYAIGGLYEFKSQNIVLQDISFNVQNTNEDSVALRALFQNNCKAIREITSAKTNKTVLAFGPDAYKSSSSFVPGISSFYENGGHATITLTSQSVGDEGVVEIFEKGNGLQFIKTGADVIRLSKAIEAG